MGGGHITMNALLLSVDSWEPSMTCRPTDRVRGDPDPASRDEIATEAEKAIFRIVAFTAALSLRLSSNNLVSYSLGHHGLEPILNISF